MSLSDFRIEYLHELRAALAAKGQSDRIQYKDVDRGVMVQLAYAGFGEKECYPGDDTPNDSFDHDSFSVHNPQSFLLHDAVVRTPYGLVSLDETVIRESLFHFPWFRFPDFARSGEPFHETSCRILGGPPDLEISDAYSAHAGIHENYYHWLILFLCRLNSAFLDSWRERYGSAPALLLPYFENDVHRASATALAAHYKLPAISMKKPICIATQRLIYPQHMRSGGLCPHPMIRETLGVLRTSFYQTGDYPEKIYISRKDSENRKMVNEDEVEALLKQFGYVSVSLSGMAFAEQVNLFAHAKKIIGPHGAGMTNIGFCNPETSILEIQMPSHLNWCYRRLSAVLGLRYGFVYGSLETDSNRHVNQRRYSVSLESLRDIFAQGF